MKLGIFEVGFISTQLKKQQKELQQFSQWQYLGKDFLSTVFIALLDFFIANFNSSAMEQLAKPKRSYQNQDANQISQYIYSLLTKQITTKEFFIKLKSFDNYNTKGAYLLEEFSDIFDLRKQQQMEKRIIADKIANFFQTSINFIGQRSLGNASKQKIFIYSQSDGFYLIKLTKPLIQYLNPPNQECRICNKKCNNYFITSECLHIACKKCLNQKVQKINTQQTIQCSASCHCKIPVRDIQQFLNEELEQQNLEQCLKLSESQQFDNSQSQSSTMQQVCNHCNQSSKQQQLYINKPCSHKYCLECFKQKINSGGQSCPVKGCLSQIEESLFQQRVLLEVDIKKFDKPVQMQNQQLTKCQKCKNEYPQNRLYKDKKCLHFICFSCVDQQVQKLIQNKSKQYFVRCPICNNTFGAEFNKYYDQWQMRLVQEYIKTDEYIQKENDQNQLTESLYLQMQQKQKNEDDQQVLYEQQQASQVQKSPSRLIKPQQQQQSLQRNENENVSSQKNFLSQVQDKQVQEENKNNFEEGECSMCFTSFSQYNKRQNIDCELHKIGNCCSINFERCPQCERKKINSSIIRPKPKLILQTFIQKLELMGQSSLYTSQIMQQNYMDSNDNFRQNSRANLMSSQIKQQRNSTMDTSLFRSQAPQNKVVNMYKAGYRY